MKTSLADLKRVLAELETHLATARKSRDRKIVAQTILRIRQFRGMVEAAQK